MRSRTTFAFLLAVGALAAGLALFPAMADDAADRISGPTQEAPWPAIHGGPDRDARALPPPQGVPPAHFELAFNLTELDTEAGDGYAHPTVANVSSEPGNEIVTAVPNDVAQDGTSHLGVHGRDGELLWSKTFEFDNMASPTVADWDGDRAREVSVTVATETFAYDQGGDKLWHTSFDQATIGTIAGGLGVDVNDDGAADLVQTARSEDPSLTDDDGDPARLFGLDGRTGDVLFTHGLSCGGTPTPAVALPPADGDGVLLVVACVSDDPTTDDGSASPLAGTVEAVRVETSEDSGGLLGVTSTTDSEVENETAWVSRAAGEDPLMPRLAKGEILPSSGEELVVNWRNESTNFGATVLDAATGEVLQTASRSPTGPVTFAFALADLDRDGYDEMVSQRGSTGFGAYELNDEPLGEKWRIPGDSDLEAGFDLELEPKGVRTANVDGQGPAEVITGWHCLNTCNNVSGSVRIHDADGELAFKRNFTVAPNASSRVNGGFDPDSDDLVAPFRDGGLGPTESDGPLAIVTGSNSRALVFQADPPGSVDG